MKKLLCVLSAVLLLTGCLFLTACGNNNPAPSNPASNPSSSTSSEPPAVPNGYKLYDNGALAFAYPSDWTADNEEIVTLMNPDGVGNNITVTTEPKTDYYESITAKSLEDSMNESYQEYGMTVSGTTIEKKSTNGLNVVVVAFTTSYGGQTMKQTGYIVTIGNYTYSVTVTETTADSTLLSNVFNTLHAVK